jgi:hypothetical protein
MTARRSLDEIGRRWTRGLHGIGRRRGCRVDGAADRRAVRVGRAAYGWNRMTLSKASTPSRCAAAASELPKLTKT